jgi:hypothetical protein
MEAVENEDVISGGHGTRNNPETTAKTALSKLGGTQDGTPDAHSGDFPPDLAAVIKAWPGLPEASRRRIVAVVQEAAE